jgi:hypothetical protein
MNEQTCNLLLDLLSEMAKRLSEAHSKIAALEITLSQYQPDMSDAYIHIQGEIRKTHPPFSIAPEVFADLRRSLLHG